MNIKQKLKRVMDIGAQLDLGEYRLSRQFSTLIGESLIIHDLNTCLALWMEFNKIQEEITEQNIEDRKPIKGKVVSCEANGGFLQRLSMEVTLQIRPKPKEASRIGDWFCNHEDIEIVGLNENTIRD